VITYDPAMPLTGPISHGLPSWPRRQRRRGWATTRPGHGSSGPFVVCLSPFRCWCSPPLFRIRSKGFIRFARRCRWGQNAKPR